MRKIKFIQHVQRSLFLKILLVFIFSYVLIFLFSIFSHRIIFQGPRFARIPRITVGYCQYLVKDIGVPPDTILAQKISDSSNVQIRFEGSNLSWASRNTVPGFEDLAYQHEFWPASDIHAGFLKEHHGLAVDITKDYGHFLFLFENPEREAFASAAFYQNILLLIFATIVIIGDYFFINWFLTPIRALHEGVEQIGQGNLDYAITTKRTDELGQLATSFNSMSGRIREMIRARDQLLLDVSHELRSPLTRMKVALEFMEDNTAKQSLKDDISETENMVAEILETERLKSPYGGLKLKRFNVSAVLKEICDSFKGQKPGIKLSHLPRQVMLQADSERLKIVFKNIISNALKFSQTSNKPVEIWTEQNSENMTIAIRDFGIGIPNEDLPYIFEPFYRVDKSRSKKTGGYGLGMNLCKKIMEAHNGKIEIQSEAGKGTTFFLKFKKMNQR